jgi:hypothetical protein
MLLLKLAGEVYELQGWEPPAKGESTNEPAAPANDKRAASRGATPSAPASRKRTTSRRAVHRK